MQKIAATQIFESLSSPIRLDIYRGLVRCGPEGMVAGQIASLLKLPPNNVSFHLKGMIHTGLVTVEQEGRFQRYRANFGVMGDLIEYLTAECCAGNTQLCPEIPSLAEKSKMNCCPSEERNL